MKKNAIKKEHGNVKSKNGTIIGVSFQGAVVKR